MTDFVPTRLLPSCHRGELLKVAALLRPPMSPTTNRSAHQLRSHHLCMTAEEGFGKSWEILGYGRGWSDNLLHPSLTTLLEEETMK